MSDQMDEVAEVAPTPASVAAHIAPRRLTQEVIDREVSRALKDAEAKLKPADYDEVKAAAERHGELQRRVAELEGEIARVQLESMRVSVAARFGIPDEDRDILLTGADEATLTLQAERLAASSRQLGNVARREGTFVQRGNPVDREMRAFVNELMGNDTFWD